MSDNAEGAIKNVCLQFTETGNIWYTRPRKTKQKHNTICCWTTLPVYATQKTKALSNTGTIPTKKSVGELRCSRRVSSSRHVTYMASVICKVCTLYESYYRKQIILDALGACLQ